MSSHDFADCDLRLPQGLQRKLSPDDLARLQALLLRARTQREAEHAAAIEAAVAQVPALLRGTLRRMLAE